jgi:hypothetical protein
MNNYTVKVPEIWITELHIEAKNKEEAMVQARAMIDDYGGYEMEEPYLSHIVDEDEWEIE